MAAIPAICHDHFERFVARLAIHLRQGIVLCLSNTHGPRNTVGLQQQLMRAKSGASPVGVHTDTTLFTSRMNANVSGYFSSSASTCRGAAAGRHVGY